MREMGGGVGIRIKPEKNGAYLKETADDNKIHKTLINIHEDPWGDIKK